MLALLLVAFVAVPQAGPKAGAEAPAPPKRVAYVEPLYPPAARVVSPPLQGIVILEMTLNNEGQPVDIKVLRAIPLLDRAAIDAAKQWRYEPTLVDGIPTGVVVQEVVDVFPDQETRARYWVDMLSKSKNERPFRILAAARLGEIGVRKKHVFEALRKATKDSDAGVSAAAARALQTLECP